MTELPAELQAESRLSGAEAEAEAKNKNKKTMNNTIATKKVPELRFPEFDDEWDSKEFKTLVKINQGLQIPINKRFTEKKKNTLFYITNEFLNPNSNKKYYIENANKSVTCDYVDILMTRTGNTGHVVTNVKGAFHNNFFKIDYPDFIYRLFLYYFLTKTKTQNIISRLAGTSTIPDLNHSDFYKIKFNFPQLPEQQKIADFLSHVDKKIDLLSQKEAALRQYKKGVMQKLFSQEIRFKIKNAAGELVNPPDWVEKRLGEVGETYNGLTSKTKEDFGKGHLYIQYKQIFDSSKIDLNKCERVDIKTNEKQNKVQFGDVFFTISSETPDEIGTASVLLDEKDNLYLNSFCFGYRLNQKIINPNFARYLFRSQGFRKSIIPLAQGSTRFNLSKKSFNKLKIYIPSIEEQTKIANFLSRIDEKIEAVASASLSHRQWKKGLLQKMFV